MLILGLDTTTLVCSVALLLANDLLAEFTLNIKKTHSQRLMPLIDSLFQFAGLCPEQLDAVAVAAGPGSFTGIRIGVATARGLAQGLSIPAVGVSTLEALAEASATPGMLVCPLLDARRDQVYTALYRRSPEPGSRLEQLIAPCAIALSGLLDTLLQYPDPVLFAGDGLERFGDAIQTALRERAVIPDAALRLNRAGLVAQLGQRLLDCEEVYTGYRDLIPVYLRLPEAERIAAEKEDRQG